MSRIGKLFTRKNIPALAVAAVTLAVTSGIAVAAQDRNTLTIPDGLAFSEFAGYENW
jgi:hypothetical protein